MDICIEVWRDSDLVPESLRKVAGLIETSGNFKLSSPGQWSPPGACVCKVSRLIQVHSRILPRLPRSCVAQRICLGLESMMGLWPSPGYSVG